MAKSKLDSLQVLRAIAALAVVLTHLPIFTAGGAFGVDIFFVISGFIICYITDKDSNLFIQKRIFRVLPLYYIGTFGVFIIALFSPSLLNGTVADPIHLLKSLLFIPYFNNANEVMPILKLGWTLNYELFFYLIFAASLYMSKMKAPYICMLFILVITLMGQVFIVNNIVFKFYTNMIQLEFCYGILIFILWKRVGFINVSIIQAYGALAFAFALYVGLFYVEWSELRFLYWGIPSVFIVGVILLFTHQIKFPLLLILIGDASYSLYLFHPYVIYGVDRLVLEASELTFLNVFVSVGVLASCIGLAILSYRYFEKPSNEWFRKRFTYKLSAYDAVTFKNEPESQRDF